MVDLEEARQLVIDALEELPNHQCSYCGSGNLIWGYLDIEDIEKFLRKHKLVKPGKGLCLKCGADREVWEEMLHEKHLCK